MTNRLRRRGTAPIHSHRAELALQTVSLSWGVDPLEIKARTRRKTRTCRARQVAMYMAHVALGVSISEVAKAFGRDRKTASHACRVVEDMRDDPLFDASLQAMETALRRVPLTYGDAR